jgi:3-polyprenyl-4-hydroxybenzoate decarboxylase
VASGASSTERSSAIGRTVPEPRRTTGATPIGAHVASGTAGRSIVSVAPRSASALAVAERGVARRDLDGSAELHRLHRVDDDVEV